VKSENGVLYRWGGESYLTLHHDDFDDSHFKYMDDFKGKLIRNIHCAFDNSIVITHQVIVQKDALENNKD